MNWKLTEPQRITAELQAEDGSRRVVHISAGELAAIGHVSAPLWDGRAKTEAGRAA